MPANSLSAMPPLTPALSIFAAALLALALLAPPPASAAECPASVASMRPGDTCHYSSWVELQPILRPTQQGIGYAWVQSKLEQKFQTAADAQAELKSSPIPVVVGLGGTALYCLDHHHTLMALELSGKHVRANVKVYVDVVCDYSDLADENAFWSKVRSRLLGRGVASSVCSVSVFACLCVSLRVRGVFHCDALYGSFSMCVRRFSLCSLSNRPRASPPFAHTLRCLLQDDSGPLRRPPIPPRGKPQPPAPSDLPVGSPADNQV